MTAERLDEKALAELETLLDEAEEGPWRAGRMDTESYDGSGEGPYKNVYAGPTGYPPDLGPKHPESGETPPYTVAAGKGPRCRSHAALIAAARNALPSLLAELRALRSSREADEGPVRARCREIADRLEAAQRGPGVMVVPLRDAIRVLRSMAPAATGESAARCGHVGPTDRATGNRTICTLSPGHDGNHDDGVVTWRATGESAGPPDRIDAPWSLVNQWRNLSRSRLGPEVREVYAACANELEQEIALRRAVAGGGLASKPPAGAESGPCACRKAVPGMWTSGYDEKVRSFVRHGRAECEEFTRRALAPSSDTGSPDTDPERK